MQRRMQPLRRQTRKRRRRRQRRPRWSGQRRGCFEACSSTRSCSWRAKGARCSSWSRRRWRRRCGGSSSSCAISTISAHFCARSARISRDLGTRSSRSVSLSSETGWARATRRCPPASPSAPSRLHSRRDRRRRRRQRRRLARRTGQARRRGRENQSEQDGSTFSPAPVDTRSASSQPFPFSSETNAWSVRRTLIACAESAPIDKHGTACILHTQLSASPRSRTLAGSLGRALLSTGAVHCIDWVLVDA
mmetsp:Transcript_49563/g.107342  ORF Transcript_49563/g.107342 Transcript_49563/m.107342 type:complete len:249 (-) Transcript_49563:305-1051(-)